MMRYTWAVLLAVPLLMHVGGAEAQNSKASVLMQIHGNAPGFPATTRCSLLSFVAAPPAAQPEVAATLCAVGGPFGAGMVGSVASTFNFRGTLQFDDTITFSPTDVLTIHNVMLNTDTVVAGPPGSDPTTTGGIQYFTGTWSITGGTGVFAGLKGQGTRVMAVYANQHVPPPPESVEAQLVGSVGK